MQKKHSQLHQSCFYNAEVKMQVNVLCSMMVFQQQLAGQSCRLALLSPLFKLNNVCKENRNDRNCCTKISIMGKKETSAENICATCMCYVEQVSEFRFIRFIQ